MKNLQMHSSVLVELQQMLLPGLSYFTFFSPSFFVFLQNKNFYWFAGILVKIRKIVKP